ncbi:hypothetical protein GW793_03190, partial [bacterium]|nr:hypothetical protein [bacterium]
ILSILAALIVTTAFVVVFPGQEVFAQESTIKVTVVGTVTADGGQQTPIATATAPAPLSGSQVLSSRFIGPEITDCPAQTLCPTAKQAMDALTIEGKVFGLELNEEQEASLKWFLQFLSVDQSQDLWDLAPNLGTEIDGEDIIQISRILSRHARHHNEVALLDDIFGISFPPAPAPVGPGTPTHISFINVLDQ